MSNNKAVLKNASGNDFSFGEIPAIPEGTKGRTKKTITVNGP
jgi:hypothetical protein